MIARKQEAAITYRDQRPEKIVLAAERILSQPDIKYKAFFSNNKTKM